MTDSDLPDLASLWDYDDPAVTEQRFRELLPQIADFPPYRLELLTQIARTFSLRRRFAEAHAALDEVDANLTDDMIRPQVRSLLERGRTFNSAGHREQARPLFEQAMHLASQNGMESLAVDAAHMVAIAAPPEETLDLNLQALALAERSSDPAARQWAGSLYNNIGWTYHEQGDYDMALHYLELARAFRLERGDDNRLRIARWSVARVLRDLGRLAEALAEQEALRKEYEALGEPSGYVYEELAECLWLTGETGAARPHFARAYELLAQDEWFVANEPERLA